MYLNQPKITTVDRILDTSLTLFNKEGFHSVSASKIAKTLGMSAGNLAYHFKNKNEILFALLPRLEKDLLEILKWQYPHAAPISTERVLYILQTLWGYRFFFVELPQVVAIDRDILRFYQMFEDHIVELMRESFDTRIAQGEMAPIPEPNSTRLLSAHVWIIWQDWLQREQLNHPGQETPTGMSVYEVMVSVYCLAQPFFPADFLTAVTSDLRRRLLPPDSIASATRKKTKVPKKAKGSRKKPA